MKKLILLSFLILVACGMSEKAEYKFTSIEPDSGVNVYVETQIFSGAAYSSINQLAIADAVKDIITKIQSGEVKPTKEVKYIAFNIHHFVNEKTTEYEDLGSSRIPFSAIKNFKSEDSREYLNLIDWIDLGTSGISGSSAANFCGINENAAIAKNYCEIAMREYLQ